jgi:tripartite-type tricarboxylate transporter receptor subunit TctC
MRLLFAIAIFSWGALALAADFPTKPLRIVVPFPPGGLLDLLGRALAAPELRERLREQGLEAQGSTSAALAAEMQSDVARLGRIVREAGIRPD